MRWLVAALAGAVFAAGVALGAAGRHASHNRAVMVAVGRIDNCNGDPVGTGCPQTISDVRYVSVRLDDGTLTAMPGRPLASAPGTAGGRWAVDAGTARLRVFHATADGLERWMDVPLRHFGGSDATDLDWSPDGRRFSYLGEDGVLVVDPARRAARLLAVPAAAKWLGEIEWLNGSKLIAYYAGRDERDGLLELDSDSGRVVRTWPARTLRTSFGPGRALAFSPAIHRLAIEGEKGHISVVDLDHPVRIRRSPLYGSPSWSPDGRRLLAGETVDTPGVPITMAAWPSLHRIRLPRVASVLWLPDARSMLALDDQASTRLLEITADGRVTRVIRADWPAAPIRLAGFDPRSSPS